MQSRYLEKYIQKYQDKLTVDYDKSKTHCSVYSVTEENLKICSELIQEGKLVSFPTETVYGLGADATNEKAIRSIYEAKGRPLTDPVIVHICEMQMVDKIIDKEESNVELLKYIGEHLWPGPLTMIVKANQDYIPSVVTAETGFVGIRYPEGLVAQQLIKLAKTPICAPSANKFAHISPTSSIHVFNDLFDKELALQDGPEACYGIESTVAKLMTDPLTGERSIYVLRHGSVPVSKIRELVLKSEKFKDVKVYEKDIENSTEITKHAEAPGQLLKHYCPMILTHLLEVSQEDQLKEDLKPYEIELAKTVVIDFGKGYRPQFEKKAQKYLDLSDDGDVEEAMKNLYAYLREAESVQGATTILVVGKERIKAQIKNGKEFFPALFDKMFRSASGSYVYVKIEDKLQFHF